MSDTAFKNLLNSWDQQSKARRELVNTQVQMSQDDAIRIEALAEVYQMSREELLATLVNTALNQIEEQIPYVAGSKVIRVEEGDPVYEDAGRMPAYIAARKRLTRMFTEH